MHTAAPPLVAAVVGVALTVRRYATALLLEFSADVTPRALTEYALGTRVVAFLLVYGLLFGVAYWTGTRREDASSDTTVAAGTFAVAALSALVSTGAILGVVGTGTRGPLLAAVTAVGSSAAVGVELAVVVFAGVAAARRT